MIVCPYFIESKRLVELYHKVILKVLRNTATIACRITNYFIFFGNHLHIRTAVESIYHHIGIGGFRESETEICATFRRSYFSCHVILWQINTIIIRSGFLCLMREPGSTTVLIDLQLFSHRHDWELTVVIDPRTRLMGLLETSDFVGCISVSPTVTHLSGLWHPEVHSPRQRDGRICIPIR